tara:strand:- start:25 stop:426 length:402 start_codon:yes stop_codon:yes gene_type:complete
MNSLKPKNIFKKFFFYLIIILLSLFYFNIKTAYASSNDWIEVSKTSFGRQYFDKNSLINKGNGILEITTKYVKIDDNYKKNIDENIYIMRINCINNKYKDISVNGKKRLTAKWERPNGDKLINDVILSSCKNA